MSAESGRNPNTSRDGALARRESILNLLSERGFVSVVEIAEMFDVSEMTARRDLQRLDESGLIRRTHGGAAWSASGTGYDPSFDTRRREQAEAKQAIGRYVAELIANGDTVGIDVGTTTLEVADALTRRQGLTVFTASVPAALALLDSDAEIYLLGGRLRKQELSLVGGTTIDQLSAYHLDKAVLGAGGLSNQHGLTDSSIEDTAVTQALISRARYRILAIDHTKFERVALAHIAPLDVIDCLVTDREPRPETMEILAANGIEIHVAMTIATDGNSPGTDDRNG